MNNYASQDRFTEVIDAEKIKAAMSKGKDSSKKKKDTKAGKSRELPYLFNSIIYTESE